MLAPSTSPDFATLAVTDKAFYVRLGQRLTEARKARGMTQVELAEALGIAQQTLAHYEGGKVRVAVALLPPIAEILGVSVDDLIGTPTKRSGKRGPTPMLQRQIERLHQLPKSQQKVVLRMLDGVLSDAGR